MRWYSCEQWARIQKHCYLTMTIPRGRRDMINLVPKSVALFSCLWCGYLVHFITLAVRIALNNRVYLSRDFWMGWRYGTEAFQNMAHSLCKGARCKLHVLTTCLPLQQVFFNIFFIFILLCCSLHTNACEVLPAKRCLNGGVFCKTCSIVDF